MLPTVVINGVLAGFDRAGECLGQKLVHATPPVIFDDRHTARIDGPTDETYVVVEGDASCNTA